MLQVRAVRDEGPPQVLRRLHVLQDAGEERGGPAEARRPGRRDVVHHHHLVGPEDGARPGHLGRQQRGQELALGVL